MTMRRVWSGWPASPARAAVELAACPVRLGARNKPILLTPGQNTLTYTVTPVRTPATLSAGAYRAAIDFTFITTNTPRPDRRKAQPKWRYARDRDEPAPGAR